MSKTLLRDHKVGSDHRVALGYKPQTQDTNPLVQQLTCYTTNEITDVDGEVVWRGLLRYLFEIQNFATHCSEQYTKKVKKNVRQLNRLSSDLEDILH